ncbi:MAG: Uncharacterized protein LiPW16_315 [Microgenomates group bacterium LiPW_16]|nr:MAG: Uncharacterized protein LiPW16_315 [Microgenomates group bacterium LiPW_16]
MKRIFEQYPEKTHRALEILLPAITWGVITMPFWLSFWHPAMVAYFVIGFDVYWFYKSATLAINALRSYLTLSAHVKVFLVGKKFTMLLLFQNIKNHYQS